MSRLDDSLDVHALRLFVRLEVPSGVTLDGGAVPWLELTWPHFAARFAFEVDKAVSLNTSPLVNPRNVWRITHAPVDGDGRFFIPSTLPGCRLEAFFRADIYIRNEPFPVHATGWRRCAEEGVLARYDYALAMLLHELKPA
jgi:hypothetical protein